MKNYSEEELNLENSTPHATISPSSAILPAAGVILSMHENCRRSFSTWERFIILNTLSLNYHNTIQYYFCNRHEPEDMMREAKICLDMEKKMGLTTWIVGGEALIARAYLLAGDQTGAEEALSRGEERLAKLGRISHMFTMNPFLARLQLEVLKLEEILSEKGDRTELKRIVKRVHKSSRLVIGQFRALQELKPEGYRLTGTLFWLEGKSSKAMHYWKKSIEAASNMPKKHELGRTYMEAGKRLLERNSLTKSFDGMDAEQCLKKAGEIFYEMNLKYDLIELEGIEAAMNKVSSKSFI